jgi:phage gp36-like protein
MAFLTKDDLLTSILTEELDEITRDDDAIVTQACLAAVTEMRQWLYDTFEVDTVFAATGTSRHALLVQYGADLAIYYIVARGQGGQDFDDRKSRYDRAINWLKAAAKTDLYADLPRRETTVQKVITYGSQPKRSNYY